ncbi:MAG: hypothetical protein IPJ19_09785 [Planctomycetes bacterium]|nr:hypothetical protein [Planctomycetota bacterium]
MGRPCATRCGSTTARGNSCAATGSSGTLSSAGGGSARTLCVFDSTCAGQTHQAPSASAAAPAHFHSSAIALPAAALPSATRTSRASGAKAASHCSRSP